jgi:hypothetical protein
LSVTTGGAATLHISVESNREKLRLRKMKDLSEDLELLFAVKD